MRPWIASAVMDMDIKGRDMTEDSKCEDLKAAEPKHHAKELSVESRKSESDYELQDDSSPSQASTTVDVTSEPSQTPSSNQDQPQVRVQESSTSFSDLSASTLSAKQNILNWLKKHKVHMQLSGHWVHFVDSGGQPSFLEIIPCLIRNIGLLMLVFKLSEELSAHTEVEYWDSNGGHYLGKFSISNEELLTYTAQLSQYHTSQITDLPFVENPNDPNPKIVIVGTFKDEEYQCRQSREEKVDRLEEIMAPFHDQLIRPLPNEDDEKKTGIMFAVNASLAGKHNKQEEKVASDLRQVIKSFAPKHNLKMPLQYLFLEVELKKEAVVTKSYSWKVAKELYFKSKEDLEYCLSYLHQVNLIFYYPKVLPKTVITQPDAVVSVITQIFQHHLQLSKCHESKVVSERDVVFLNQAIFPTELLQQLKIDYNMAVLPHSDMMMLLQHRLIVAPVFMDSSTNHYFMPSLLREIPPTILRKAFKPKSHVSSPLTISFPGSWAPNGVSSALTNKLLSFKGKACFELAASKQWNVHKLVKNVVHMIVEIERNIGRIILVNLMEYFEVYISHLSHKYLPLIEDILDENLQAVYATLSYSVSHKFGILCECGQKPRHAAFLSHDNSALTCSMTGTSYFKRNKVKKASHLIEPALGPYSHHQYDDENYPGICFLGKPLEFIVDSKGGQFAHPNCGISLKVPPDAVPPGVIQKMLIRPCVSGPFKYPEGHEPLSAVYLISPKVTFQKNVELRLEHYGRLETDEQARQITFLSAKTIDTENGERVFYMKPLLNGGRFAVHERYGTLQLKHFCPLGVSTPKNSKTKKKYGVLFSHSRKEEKYHCAAIGVSLFEKVYMENFKHFIQEEHAAVQFSHYHRLVYFQSDEALVMMPNINGWNVIANSEPCSFKQEEVDLPEWEEEIAQSKEYYPPRYIFTLIPDDEATSSKCQLQLTGMTDKNLKFSFELTCANKPPNIKQKGHPSQSYFPSASCGGATHLAPAQEHHAGSIGAHTNSHLAQGSPAESPPRRSPPKAATDPVLMERPSMKLIGRIQYMKNNKKEDFRVIDSVASDWEAVARELDFDEAKIATYRKASSGDQKQAANVMLSSWTMSNVAATWAKFIGALEGANLTVPAKDFEYALLHKVE